MIIKYGDSYYKLDDHALKFSGLLYGLLGEDRCPGEFVELPDESLFKKENFQFIVDFLNTLPGRVFDPPYNFEDPMPNKDTKLTEAEIQWGAQFDSFEDPSATNPGLVRKPKFLRLWSVFVDSNILNIPLLKHVIARTLANYLKGLDTQQIRDMMGIGPYDPRFVKLHPDRYLTEDGVAEFNKLDSSGRELFLNNIPENYKKNAPYGFTPEEYTQLEQSLSWSRNN